MPNMDQCAAAGLGARIALWNSEERTAGQEKLCSPWVFSSSTRVAQQIAQVPHLVFKSAPYDARNSLRTANGKESGGCEKSRVGKGKKSTGEK
jgi:hypothetical protein